MKNLILTAVLASISFNALAGGFCEGSRARSNAEQIAQLDPNIDLDIVDLDLFNGGSAVAGYEYEVEPAYTNGLYARTDRWQIGLNLVPHTGHEPGAELEWRFGVGARHASEATFIRFFDNACNAEIAKPYSPRRIPMKADRALSDKFKIGDYFFFKASLGFVVNLDLLQLLGNPMAGVGLHAGYLLEGSYQVHIVRQDAKHVRLKIVARRGREGSLGLSLGWKNEAFDVFGVSVLDSQLRRQLNPTPVKVAYSDTKASAFLIDYVLDLTDPAVADAFNKMLRLAADFRSLRLASPFRDIERVEQGLILDISPLEDLYRADYRNGNVNRVKRSLRSSSGQDGRAFTADLGNRILGMEFDATSATSRISLREPDDSVSRYLLKSFDRTFDGQFGFSWIRLYTKRSLDFLLKAEEGFQDLTALNIAQTLERKDKHLRKSEFDEIRMTLRKALPKEIYDRIPFDSWGQGRRETLRNFGMRFQLVMGPEVILNNPSLTEASLVTRYTNYITAKGFKANDFFSNTGSTRNGGRSAEEQFQEALSRITHKLSQASDARLSDIQRLEAFMDLRDNTLFTQTGIGFLMSQQPEQAYRLDLNLSANDRRLDHVVGDESIARFYRQLLTIKAALEDAGLDIRREAESLAR